MHAQMCDHEKRLLQLSPKDNVCAVAVPIKAGERIEIRGQSVIISQPLPMGFKVANQPIAMGEKVLKYGAPLGTATADIAIGELVHTHNLKSDYLPTYLLEDGENPFAKED